jgi:hypothetical protein
VFGSQPFPSFEKPGREWFAMCLYTEFSLNICRPNIQLYLSLSENCWYAGQESNVSRKRRSVQFWKGRGMQISELLLPHWSNSW